MSYTHSLAVAFLLCAALPAAAAPATPAAIKQWPAEQISSYTLTIAANGDEADIYYPQLDAGSAWQYLDQFPVVLMNQGAMVDKEYYSMLAISVARQGFVVVVPNQRNSLLGNMLRYAEVSSIGEVLAQMRTEDASPGSPIYGIVDPSRLALMGHSFGGAATIFAVGEICQFPFCRSDTGFQRPAELRAAVLVSSNSGGQDVDTTGIPVAIISGSLETSRATHVATYEVLEPPKAFVSVEGATHYGMCDADTPPGAGVRVGEPAQAVPQAISAARYGYWAGVFLRAHVLNDARAKKLLYAPKEWPGITIVSQPN